MARITVEDCLENISNRFALVLITAKRAKELLKGETPMISDERGNKQVVISLREVAAGYIGADDQQLSDAPQDDIDFNYQPAIGFEGLPPEAD